MQDPRLDVTKIHVLEMWSYCVIPDVPTRGQVNSVSYSPCQLSLATATSRCSTMRPFNYQRMALDNFNHLVPFIVGDETFVANHRNAVGEEVKQA